MKIKILHCFVLIVGFVVASFGQTKRPLIFEKDTIILDTYKGKMAYSYYNQGGKKIKNGTMSFNSDLIATILDDRPGYSELTIKGNYADAKKHGDWTVINNYYILENAKLQKSPIYLMSHEIAGYRMFYNLKFQNGQKSGIWTIKNIPIDNGKTGKESKLAEIKFKDNRLNDNFHFNLEVPNYGLVKVNGFINNEGFLDKKMRIDYRIDSILINENRLYEDGFLLEITKINGSTNEVLEQIQYLDVRHNLVDLSKIDLDVQIVKEMQGHGLLFNNNYDTTDKKILSQEDGNEILESAALLFETIDNIFESEQQKIESFNTRRFKYIYPQDEPDLLTRLKNQNTKLTKQIDQIRQRPKFVLRKTQSQNLTFTQHQLNLYKSKIDVIDSVLNLISNGFFDSFNRAEYYSNGIAELKSPDTIKYEFQAKNYTHILEVRPYITGHNNLLSNFEDLQNNINSELDKIDSEIQQSLIQYDEQDKIDSLESIMSKYYSDLEVLYKNYYYYKKTEPEAMPFVHKMYESVNERILKPANNKYLNNSMDFEEAVMTAKNIICLQQFLVDRKEELARISSLQKYWNDSVFTIYQDNPFDYRQFETKIMPGTLSAANVFLVHQANNLLNAKTCEALNEELGLIKKLEKRVLYLRKNADEENVKLLDKSLRRERVPQRIQRLLEL